MTYPIKDCKCEDFPCCEHADNYPAEPEYCNMCGYTYYTAVCPCEDRYEDDEDDEDEVDEDESPVQDGTHVNLSEDDG
jgi:hypothetical protein